MRHLLPPPTRSGSSQSRPFPCLHPGCSYAAKQKGTLTTHSKTHSDEKSFVCSHPNCNFTSNYKNCLILHIRTHTGEKKYKCQFESCSYATARLSHLVLHSRTHTKERPYKCPEANCKYSTTQIGNLKTHQLTHSPREGEERPSFPCPICEYQGKSKKCLSSHIIHHTQEKFFKCDEPDSNCNYEAKTKGNLERHKRLKHSDEKPFACSFESCDYRCKSKANLSTHLKSHSEERRYKCELCLFRGKTRQVVTNHLKHVHADPNLRPFKCKEPQCTCAFKRNSDLNGHLLIHKGEKNYSCSFPLCDYRSISKSHLKSHQNNIHNDKKEKCTICGYKCKTKTQLTTHIRTHTKEEPYKCKVDGCDYRTTTTSCLSYHHKKYHPQVFG